MPKKIIRRLSAKDRLEILEKYAEGQDPKSIAKDMGRSLKTISSAIEKLKKTSLKAFNNDVSSIPENSTIEPENYIDTQVYQNVVRRLLQAGIDQNIAKQRIAKICNNAKKNDIEEISEDDLYNIALNTINGSELFISETNNKDDGVTILTPAASQRSDDSPKSSTVLKKNVDGDRIFKI